MYGTGIKVTEYQFSLQQFSGTAIVRVYMVKPKVSRTVLNLKYNNNKDPT
jgi:hypothetical protein